VEISSEEINASLIFLRPHNTMHCCFVIWLKNKNINVKVYQTYVLVVFAAKFAANMFQYMKN